MQCDTVWRNCRLLVKAGQPVIENGMIATKDGHIVYAGPAADFTGETIDLQGRLVTPGLIDCHTHLVFAGNRANEFRLRLDGATYEEIARAGGAYNDVHLVVLTALVLADELYEAREAPRRTGALQQQPAAQAPAVNAKDEEQIVRVINQLTKRIEGIASKVQAA